MSLLGRFLPSTLRAEDKLVSQLISFSESLFTHCRHVFLALLNFRRLFYSSELTFDNFWLFSFFPLLAETQVFFLQVGHLGYMLQT